MKVLFLDVDGVLNEHLFNNEVPSFKEEKIELLSYIVERTGAFIVLHSGWRYWLDEHLSPTREEMRLFVEALDRHHLKIYDKTPDLADDYVRRTGKLSLVKAREILLWLEQHNDVEAYVVLEDLDLNNDIIAWHQVKTVSTVGLTKNKAEEAIHKLT